jgi:hypothetical protein
MATGGILGVKMTVTENAGEVVIFHGVLTHLEVSHWRKAMEV